MKFIAAQEIKEGIDYMNQRIDIKNKRWKWTILSKIFPRDSVKYDNSR